MLLTSDLTLARGVLFLAVVIVLWLLLWLALGGPWLSALLIAVFTADIGFRLRDWLRRRRALGADSSSRRQQPG